MIRFEASQVFNNCYHAMLGDLPVGMVILESDGRWHATAYRAMTPDDLKASFLEREGAEEFVRSNMQATVRG